MSRIHICGFCALVLAGQWLVAPATASTYNFDALVDGPIAGQDGWNVPGGNASVVNGTGVNTSKVLSFTIFPTSPRRVNDANYSFPTWNGTETQAFLEIDMTFGQPRTVFYLQDSVDQLNQSPWLGFNGANYELRAARSGAVSTAAVSPAAVAGDWMRLRLDMDFTANGGNGAMSLSYMNLTAGQVAYTPVPTLQNLVANFSANPGPNKYGFDTMWFRTDAPTTNLIDNLSVGAVPEPSAVVLASLGLFGLIAYGRRAKNSTSSCR